MDSNLYLSIEVFFITVHVFCSSKGLALNVGCLESFILLLLLFCLFIFSTEIKTFKTWASTKYFSHRNTDAYTAQVARLRP